MLAKSTSVSNPVFMLKELSLSRILILICFVGWIRKSSQAITEYLKLRFLKRATKNSLTVKVFVGAKLTPIEIRREVETPVLIAIIAANLKMFRRPSMTTLGDKEFCCCQRERQVKKFLGVGVSLSNEWERLAARLIKKPDWLNGDD